MNAKHGTKRGTKLGRDDDNKDEMMVAAIGRRMLSDGSMLDDAVTNIQC